MIETGQKVPEGTLFEMTADGPAQVASGDLFNGRKVAVFGVPGAFTPTCHNTHLPSFVEAIGSFREKGFDDVICLSVNDPFVMGKWGEITGASAAGIRMIGDASGAFVKEMGLDFSADVVGLLDRTKRFAAVVEDGTVTMIVVEANPGEAEATSATALMTAAGI